MISKTPPLVFLELLSTCGHIRKPLTTWCLSDVLLWQVRWVQLGASFWHLSYKQHCQESCDALGRLSYKHASTFPQRCFSFKLLPSKFTREDHRLFFVFWEKKFGSFPLMSERWHAPRSRPRSWIHSGSNIWLLLVAAYANLIVKLKLPINRPQTGLWKKCGLTRVTSLHRNVITLHTQSPNAARYNFPSHSSPLLSGPTLLGWGK